MSKKPPSRRARIHVSQYQAITNLLCAPLFWLADDGPHNGTMSFLRTTSTLLGLTNVHVADALERLPDDVRKEVKIGSTYFDSEKLVARCDRLDLATYELSEVTLASSLYNTASVSVWPPPRPQVGEVVVMSGYPASFREDKDGDTSFVAMFYAGFVEESSDTNLIVHVDIEGSNRLSDEHVDPDMFFGGISGGPLFRIVDDIIERPELAGIIHQVHDESRLVFAHPLLSMMPDGTFIDD